MAGGTADALGVSFQQLMTFGSMLTPMFGSASSAGASLAYMMRNLAHPATTKMADEIKHLGLAIYDSKGNFVGLQNIMDQLFTKMQGMTQQQKIDVIGTLFNVRSGRAAMDLMSMTRSQFDATYSRIFDRIGQVDTAQKDSAAINNTTTGTWNRLTTTLNDFFAKSGEGINSILKPFYNSMNNILSAAQKNHVIVEFFAAFLVAGVVVAVLFVLTAAIVMFGPIVAGVAIGFGLVVAAAAEVATIFTILTTKGNLFSGALSFLNPVVNMVRGAFQFLVADIQKNSASFTALWNAIKPVLIVLGAILALLVVGPIVLFALAILGIVDAAGQFIAWLQKMWNELKLFGTVLADVGTLMHDVFTGQWGKLAGDCLNIQRDWNSASLALADQQAADAKRVADKEALDAQQAALKKKQGVLLAQAQEADAKAKSAQQEYDYDIQMANASKDKATKAAYEKAANVAKANMQEQQATAATMRAEATDVGQQMTALKNNATASAQQAAQGVIAHMTQMSKQSGLQTRLLKGTVTADLLGMKDDGIAEAVKLAAGVDSSLSGLAAQSATWGKDLAANFANGIASGQGLAAIAAYRIASKVAATLQHSVPKEGPLANDDEWGGHLVENFANGMLGHLGLVEHAGNALAGTVARTVTSPSITAGAIAGAVTGANPRGGAGTQVYNISLYPNSKQVAQVVYDSLKGTLQQNGMSRNLR
jgi:hypothetical protein